MLLAIDIGNSCIKFGIFDGETLNSKFSIPTIHDLTADDITLAVGSNIDLPISSAVVCSVVPEINVVVDQYLKATFDINADFVTNDFDFDLEIKYSFRSICIYFATFSTYLTCISELRRNFSILFYFMLFLGYSFGYIFIIIHFCYSSSLLIIKI